MFLEREWENYFRRFLEIGKKLEEVREKRNFILEKK